MEYGMLPSTGTVGDSRDNAMAESADGAYRTGLVWRRKPFRDPRDPEPATFRRVSRRGPEASAPALGLRDTGSGGNRVLYESSVASRLTIKAKQKPGHFIMFGGFVKLLRHCGGFTRLACIDGFEPHLVHGVGDFVESFGPESGVYVECDARRGMAKLFLEGLDIRAAGDGDGRVGVT